MNRMKKLAVSVMLGAVCVASSAQTVSSTHSGTNSPYSQFGIGALSEQAGGVGRGMNGLGVAYRDHIQVNHLNPASYSAVDSLTFIFDVGLSGQLSNFEEGNKRVNAKSASFDYAVASFRMARHLGMGFGVIPISNIGYNYSLTNRIGTNSTASYTSLYKGSGGLHEAFLGLGWEPFKGFSFGVNGGYLWGGYDRSVVNSYTEASTSLSKYYSADVRSYKLDFGVQLTLPLTKKDKVTLGATYGLGHQIGGNPTCLIVSTNSTTSVADTTSYPRTGKLQLEIPTTIGAGLMWNHRNKWKVGADYVLQKWGSVKMPEYISENGQTDYRLTENHFSDLQKLTLGAEYCPDENSTRRYVNRIRYRFGVSYASPYLKINGQDGPKEYSASVGLGIPIVNVWNKYNRSIVNVSFQWVRQESKTFITENMFRINIGITFNERWFEKWKVE